MLYGTSNPIFGLSIFAELVSISAPPILYVSDSASIPHFYKADATFFVSLFKVSS